MILPPQFFFFFFCRYYLLCDSNQICFILSVYGIHSDTVRLTVEVSINIFFPLEKGFFLFLGGGGGLGYEAPFYLMSLFHIIWWKELLILWNRSLRLLSVYSSYSSHLGSMDTEKSLVRPCRIQTEVLNTVLDWPLEQNISVLVFRFGLLLYI